MITNKNVTIYHKSLDTNTRLEKWTRYNYNNVWFFDGQNSTTNKGYSNANNVQVRIPYENRELDINDLAIGDIIVEGELDTDISTQQDLSSYLIYNIRSIRNNNFGCNPHIHITGE